MSFADSNFSDKVDLDIDQFGITLTLPRPVLDVNTKDFLLLDAPVPIIDRGASEILFEPRFFFFDSPFLASALDDGAFARQVADEVAEETILEARARRVLEQRIEIVAGRLDESQGEGLSRDDIERIIDDELPDPVERRAGLRSFILRTVFGFERDSGESGPQTLEDVVGTDIQQLVLPEGRRLSAFRERVRDLIADAVAPAARDSTRLTDRIETVTQRVIDRIVDGVQDAVQSLRNRVGNLEDRVDRLDAGLRERVREAVRDLLPTAFLSTPRAYIYQALVAFLRENIDQDRATDIREITNGFVVFLVDDDTRESLSAEADKARA